MWPAGVESQFYDEQVSRSDRARSGCFNEESPRTSTLEQENITRAEFKEVESKTFYVLLSRFHDLRLSNSEKGLSLRLVFCGDKISCIGPGWVNSGQNHAVDPFS